MVKKTRQFNKYVDKVEQRREQSKTSRKLKEKLDRQALAMDAAEARQELMEVKKAEKYKKDIQAVRDYKAKQRPSIMKGFDFSGGGMIDFGGYENKTNDMFGGGDLFGMTPKKRRKKRKK